MILIKSPFKVEIIQTARSTVHPYSDGKVSVGSTVYNSTVYNESEVLDLKDEYRVQEIRDAQKRIRQAEKELAELLVTIFDQYKRG